MPDNANISLDVRDFPSNGSDGYTNTAASNGAVYSYKYSGGTGHGGDVAFTGRGRVTVTVQLQSDPRYWISNVGFTNDTNNQLSWLNSNAHEPKTVVIQNVNTVEQTANYKITVTDKTANCTIPCDPKIINN
jgi:hypothetical protein